MPANTCVPRTRVVEHNAPYRGLYAAECVSLAQIEGGPEWTPSEACVTGQLLRPRYDRKVAGVCAAFARAYGWDPTIVRLITVALVLFGGGGVLAYVICWVIIPEDPVALPSYPSAAAPQTTQEPVNAEAYAKTPGAPSAQ